MSAAVPVSLDHLVVAAATLEEGARWVEEQLGVAPIPGGKHALMGTHNRLLGLGERLYLEVIAIDPQAPPPRRPRWFALDSEAMRMRLARSPALIHWVVRTEALEEALAGREDTFEILAFERGPYRWRMGVPTGGHLPCGGRCATIIHWEGTEHPADALPDSHCRLLAFAPAEGARIATPGGVRELRLPE